MRDKWSKQFSIAGEYRNQSGGCSTAGHPPYLRTSDGDIILMKALQRTLLSIALIILFANKGQTGEPNQSFSVTLQSGYYFYRFSNYNQLLTDAQEYLDNLSISNSFEPVSGDFYYGVRIGYHPDKRFYFSCGINMSSVESDSRINFKYPSGKDNIVQLRTIFQLLPFSVRAHFKLPFDLKKVNAVFFAELSYNLARYKQEMILPSSGSSSPLPNSSTAQFGYAPGLNIYYHLGKRVSLALEAKYSTLRISGFKDEKGETLTFVGFEFGQEEKKPAVSLDYSGIALLIGLRIRF